MLPKKPRRQDTETLIWEYLDGEISPSRAQTLSGILERRESARQRLVESAMLQGLLFSYYQEPSEQTPISEASQDHAGPWRARRRRGKRPAA